MELLFHYTSLLEEAIRDAGMKSGSRETKMQHFSLVLWCILMCSSLSPQHVRGENTHTREDIYIYQSHRLPICTMKAFLVAVIPFGNVSNAGQNRRFLLPEKCPSSFWSSYYEALAVWVWQSKWISSGDVCYRVSGYSMCSVCTSAMRRETQKKGISASF